MTGVNFAAGKAFVISSTSGFVYVYDMNSLRPAGRIKIGTNIQLETATTDTKDEKLYLAESTNQFECVIIDAKTEAVRAGDERRPVPVGHAHHGQQGQLLPLMQRSKCEVASAKSVGELRACLLALHFALCACALPHLRSGCSRSHPRRAAQGDAVTESQADELTLTLTQVAVRPIQMWVRTAGDIDTSGQDPAGHRLPNATPRSSSRASASARSRPSAQSSMYQARVTR